MAFINSGLRVIPAPTGYSVEARGRLLDFVPNTAALRDSYFFFHELTGIAWYRLKFLRDR
jgi:hypothetical protein